MRSRSRILRFPALLILFALCSGPALKAQETDDLRTLIDQARDYPGASQVLLFDRTEADVQETGLTYVTQERLWKVLTPSGALGLRAVVLDYDPQSGYVEFKAGRIYRKDGTVVDLSLETVQDFPAPARAIYWGLRNVQLPVGRLEPGDALYVKSFRKGFTYALLGEEGDDDRFIPPMRGHYYDIVPFYDSHPIAEKSYTALLPADKPLQYEVYNGEATSSIRFREGKVEYRWVKRDIEPMKTEPSMVSQSDVGTKLLVSTSPDWFAKSRWFYQVNEDYGSFDVTPEVQAKVDSLLQGVEDDEEKVRILTHWVADEIRYSGITMGEGEGFTLHKGAMTFNDRCGVCKDKAGMLITMLRAAGFESYPAMTMAGSRIDYVPADQFNHCVTLLKHDGILEGHPGFGEYRLLDPTWVPFSRELWSSAEQQQNYLPGVPEGADLQETPLSAPENHYLRITGTSRLDAEGGLAGTFTAVAEGQSDAALRWNLVRRSVQALWPNYFDGVLHDISSLARIEKIDYLDPYDLSRPMEITISYRIPRYAVVVGDKILFTPLVARFPFSDTARFLRMNLDLKDRKYPFRARTSRLVELSETVELPEGYAPAKMPEFENVDGDAASFSGAYRGGEGTLAFEARLALMKRIYDPGDNDNFCRAVKGLKKVMEDRIVLER